jgi:hypothetical protein
MLQGVNFRDRGWRPPEAEFRTLSLLYLYDRCAPGFVLPYFYGGRTVRAVRLLRAFAMSAAGTSLPFISVERLDPSDRFVLRHFWPEGDGRPDRCLGPVASHF